MKIGITGAGGFIGQHLFSHLKKNGFSVTGFTSNHLNRKLLYVDLFDLNSVTNNFQDFDVLIHLAWIGSDRKNRDILEVQNKNVLIAQNLINAKKNMQVKKIIGVGSQEELKDGEQPWGEGSSFSPITHYAQAKYKAFSLYSENFEEFTWARLFSVYGLHDKRDWILNRGLLAILKNEVISVGACEKPWSLTHVGDVAAAFNVILELRLSGIINISSLEAPILRSHLELLQSIVNKKVFEFKQREVSRTIGKLETAGWKELWNREKGFRELLKQ